MKTYTDGNILVQAESMTDVEYFREYDGDMSYPDDNPKMGMFVMHGNALTMHWAFYPDPDNFFARFKEVKDE
ncbi:hypothetical protein [Moraxella sp. VT-16-12]|uniref:hypothetical protein n=1 Tax=Moraxella sp. VT-16-12 TaxID=2014877 RepID=UPI000B7CE902|nr:hypothetical protein [Moraxella sp. VT-16-12]TWV81545.1 hypothetical protein CEW93_007465 [Moraxella sp. VT-16-12]